MLICWVSDAFAVPSPAAATREGGDQEVHSPTDGTLVASSREPCALRHPRPNWTELDAETWYRAACDAIGARPFRERVARSEAEATPGA